MSGWLVIVNPAAARNRCRGRLDATLDALRPFADRIVLTARPGDAEAVARASTAHPSIGVVGGDGTLSEVIRGMDWNAQHVAIVPAGRGNSLARDLRLTSERSGVDAMANGRRARIDLMDLTAETRSGGRLRRQSASTIAIGYPAAATATANRWFGQLGRWSYVAAATAESFRQGRVGVERRMGDGRVLAKRITGLLINNTRHAANFLACPAAQLDDGECDIAELNAGCLKQNLHNVSVLSRGLWFDPAERSRARVIEVCLAEPSPLMVDGDICPEVTAFTVSVLPRRLSCAVLGGSA